MNNDLENEKDILEKENRRLQDKMKDLESKNDFYRKENEEFKQKIN